MSVPPPFPPPCKSVSCWFLLFYLERGPLIYDQLSQIVEGVFNSLTAKHPEYQNCGSSLAAFIIVKGKSVLCVLRSGKPRLFVFLESLNAHISRLVNGGEG